MAFVSAHYLFNGSALNVIPWGILALCCGMAAQSKAQAWKLGALLGFSISFFFLWFDKSDHTSAKEFFELLLIIPIPSVFGAGCGAILSRLTFGVLHLHHKKT